jgi:transglutaminase-like putative cysteine protease
MNGNVKKPVLSPEELKKLLVPEAPVVIPRLGNWWQWVNLALLFLTLEVAVYSIERAQWIYPQPAFTLLLFLSMLLVWLLVVARLHWALTHGIAVVTGVLVTIWQSIILLPGTHSIGHLFNVFQLWWQGSAGALLPEEQKVVFAAVLTLLTWLLGYLATWFVLRKNNPWVAICLGALILIANLSNLPARYYFFFPAFFIAAVFLIIQTRIAGQFVRSGRGSGYSFKSVIYLFASLVCIISLAASLAWYSPQARASGLQSYISARFTWKQNLTDSKINIFNVIPAKQVMNTSSTLKEVDFEKGWNQGQTLHFTIKSDRPAYWPIDIYDSYTAQGWINGPTTSQLVDAKKPFTDLGPNLDDVMNYEVTTEINTDVLAVAGNFVASSEPVQVHQNAAGDVTEVTIPRILAPGEHYTVETVLPNPTADQLAAAGTGYPQNILDSYLQLPANYSPEVQALSENVTAAAATPYEKARAVVKYLSAFPYQAIINAPPAGSDGVAYFLFQQKSGFCLYFASAMAVMLRSVDVPTRLVVGYLPGDPGSVPGTYLVRDWHYHAWAQVYFPGYGWVNFEATPGGGGGSGSQVSAQTSLVSVPAIRDLPQWNVWNYPLPSGSIPPGSAPPLYPTASPTKYHSSEFFFARALGRTIAVFIFVVLLLGVLFALFVITRRVFNRRLWFVDRDDLAYTTYAGLCRLAALAKITPHPQQTPLEFAAELKAALPEETENIDTLIRAYQENRFGNREGKPALYQEAQLLKARRVLYDKLLRLMGKRTWGLKIFTPGGN